jgi:hypothetical protein
MRATTTMKLMSMPTQMPKQMREQMWTQTSFIAFAASNIAAATTAITIATCHRRRSCPQDDRPSGRWPLALKPIAIHAAVRRHCSLLLLQFDAAELRAMTSPLAHDRAMINAQLREVR